MADPVPVTSPDGQEGTVPAEDLDQALKEGYRLKSTNADLPTQIGAFGEGVGRGLIPGFPTVEAAVLPQTGSIEKQNERRKLGASTAGELVGGGLQMVGLAAATGGLGELLPGVEAAADVNKGVDALKAVKAAGATPEAIASATDMAAEQAPKTLEAAQAAATATPGGGIPVGYAQQAVAGAGQNATNYVNESELGDHEFNGQALLHEIGIGAVTGALGEGAINVLRDTVAPPVIRAAGKALDSAQEKAFGLWSKGVEALNPEAAGLVRPTREAIEAGAGKVQNNAAEAISDAVNGARDKISDVNSAHFGDYQPKEAEKLLSDTPMAQVLGSQPGTPEGFPGLLKVKAGIDQSMGIIDQNLKGAASYTDKGAFNKISNVLDQYSSDITGAKSAADLQKATVIARRGIDQSGLWSSGMDQRLAADLNEGVRKPLMDALNNPDLWGAEMAGRNQAFNSAYTAYLNTGKQALSDLGKGALNDVGQKEFAIDAAKLRNAMNGDPLANKAKLANLADHLDAAKNLVKEVGTSAANAGAQIPGGDDLKALLDSAVAQKTAAQKGAAINELQKALSTSQRWGFGALGVAPTAGYAAHALGASNPVAAVVLGLAASLRAPVKAMQMYAKVAGTAAKARDLIGTGVRKIFNSEPAKAAIIGTVSNAIRGKGFQSEAGASAGNNFARQSKHIAELAADTGRLQDNLQANTGRLASVAPNTALAAQTAAVRAVTALNAALPRNAAPSMLQSENAAWEPNATQLAAWNNLHAAVLNPQSYLQKVAAGTATPEVWQTLQQVYPQWTAEVQKSMTDQLASKPKAAMTTSQKLAVSTILGTPVSPTVSPDQVAFQQSMFAAPAGGPATPHPTQQGLSKLDLGSRSMSGHQRSK
jgi:hypothetical protein